MVDVYINIECYTYDVITHEWTPLDTTIRLSEFGGLTVDIPRYDRFKSCYHNYLSFSSVFGVTCFENFHFLTFQN